MCDGVVFAHGFFDWVTVAPLGVRTGAVRPAQSDGHVAVFCFYDFVVVAVVNVHFALLLLLLSLLFLLF